MSDPHAQLPSRSGAHRPRRGPWRDALPTVAVLIAVVLIGLGAWALTRSTASTITSSGSDDTGSASRDATVPTAPTTGASTGSATPSTPSTPTSATSSAAGGVDRSTPVTVLNATRTSGLAASLASTLRSLGWTVPTTDNYRRSEPPTTVFYGSADQRSTAQAVADDVGGDPEVQQSSEFGTERITVVIGSDYSG